MNKKLIFVVFILSFTMVITPILNADLKQASKQLCPNECCSNDERFFDRACPSDMPYCINGGCSSTPQTIENSDTNSSNILIIAGAIIVGFIILAIVLMRVLRSKK